MEENENQINGGGVTINVDVSLTNISVKKIIYGIIDGGQKLFQQKMRSSEIKF